MDRYKTDFPPKLALCLNFSLVSSKRKVFNLWNISRPLNTTLEPCKIGWLSKAKSMTYLQYLPQGKTRRSTIQWGFSFLSGLSQSFSSTLLKTQRLCKKHHRSTARLSQLHTDGLSGKQGCYSYEANRDECTLGISKMLLLNCLPGRTELFEHTTAL